jgi:hypothetical protein
MDAVDGNPLETSGGDTRRDTDSASAIIPLEQAKSAAGGNA